MIGRTTVGGRVPPPSVATLATALVLHLDSSLSVDTLAHALWGDAPPPTARKAIQNAVVALRRLLGDAGAIETAPGSYRLRASVIETDLGAFEQCVREAAAAFAAGDHQRAVRCADDGLGLWRGDPFADAGAVAEAVMARASLDVARAELRRVRVRALRELGDAGVVAELREMVAENPLDEEVWAILVACLVDAGRTGEALRAYEEARRAVGELGALPGPALREAEARLACSTAVPDTLEIRYAEQSESRVAFHVIEGTGPDVVIVPYGISNLESDFEIESVRDFELRLAAFSRVIRLDLRGDGLSDPLPGGRLANTLDEAAEDILTVLDALGSGSAVLFAWDAGAATAIHLAAMEPQRVAGLILMHGFARARWADDYPHGVGPEFEQELLALATTSWGSGAVVRRLNPSVDPRAEPGFLGPRTERLDATRARAVAMIRQHFDIDVRQELASVKTPTLLLHRRSNQFITIGHSRFLEEHIPHSTLVELGGDSNMPFLGDVDAVVELTEDFLRHCTMGTPPAP